MSYIPIREAETLNSDEWKSFLGLNRSESYSAGEFADMSNMSSREFPYLCQRPSRSSDNVYNKIFKNTSGGEVSEEITGARAVISVREDTEAKGFCGVIGTKFYYNGYEKRMKKPAVYDDEGNFKYGMAIDETGKIQLLWANRIIIIHGYDCESRAPYIYYYDTDDCGTSSDYVKSYEYKLESYYTQYTINMQEDGTGVIDYIYHTSSTFEGGYFDFKAGDSIFIDNVMTYSDSRWKDYKKSDITSAIVTDYSETLQNISGGNYIWKITLKIKFYNNKGEAPFDEYSEKAVEHIYKKIPYMTRLAIHKGRLWGANPNGEYVYASALGELFEFNRFENLSGDSVFLESSSQGGYPGVISCGDALVTLKKNELEAIYGDLPNEFAAGKSYSGYGCCDINSCVVIDNVLYYLGFGGFYAWSGSRPVLISKNLSKVYVSAFAYSDGREYHASAKDEAGNTENLVFDTERGLWHIEDSSGISGFFRQDDKCFILTSGQIWQIGSGSEIVDWYADSVKFFCDDYELDRVNELWVSAKLAKGAELCIYVRCEEGEWKKCACMTGSSGERKVYRAPVRLGEGNSWQYRLAGSGECLLCGVKLMSDRGGRLYSNERIDII